MGLGSDSSLVFDSLPLAVLYDQSCFIWRGTYLGSSGHRVLFIMIFISITTVSATAGNISKHEAAITEYKDNFQLYRVVLEKMCTHYPVISEKILAGEGCKLWCV